MGGPSPEPILQAATGFMVSKHLFVASEVGLFTALTGGPLPLRELAEATGLPPRTARIVADAACALGLLEQKDGLYANGEAAQAFLSGAGPADLRPLLRFWNAISCSTTSTRTAAGRSSVASARACHRVPRSCSSTSGQIRAAPAPSSRR